MKEAIQKAIEGGYDFSRKLRSAGLGDGVWELKKPDEVVVRRKEVLIDYSEIVKYHFPLSMVREDPLFWQALGKSLGWGVVKNVTKKKCKECMGYGYTLGENGEEYDCYTCGNTGREVTEEIVPSPWKNNWKYFWHQFIDHLAEGKDPEEFFKELIK